MIYSCTQAIMATMGVSGLRRTQTLLLQGRVNYNANNSNWNTNATSNIGNAPSSRHCHVV